MSVEVPKPGSKESWGPRVWRILHNLAFTSDRADVLYIWKNTLKSLANTMPCPACRQHLGQYIASHTIFSLRNIHLLKGPDVKARIILVIWGLHNEVNKRNGKPNFPMEALNALYEGKTRSDIINETYNLLREIHAEWEPLALQQNLMPAFREWRSDITRLVGLVASGPQLG
jgi:hypothetical protein